MILCMCGVIAVSGYLSRNIIIQWLIRKSVPIYIGYIIIILILLVPFIYLYILGICSKEEETEKDKYEKLFAEIGFKGKDGKYPLFCEVKEVDKKLIYKFYSNISLEDWKKNKSILETALNVNILAFEQNSNKKIVEITTVAADFKIPTMIKWSDELICEDDGVLRLGESALETIEFDLNKVPHVLFAGETGSGKSVLLRTCLWQMIYKNSMVFMIDFKGGVEFGIDYERFGEVITERKRALQVLTNLCEENEKRLALFRSMKVKNLAEFNRKSGKNLCRIGLFCDEIAEMLDKTGVAKEDKQLYCEIEAKLSTLARLSRATGINLFLGVQRPDAKVLTGQIKNNIPVRVCGRFADDAASEIVLGTRDASKLPKILGRFLFKVGNEVIQFQSFFFDDEKMLHDIDRKVGGTLTELKQQEHEQVDIRNIKIYGGVEQIESEIPEPINEYCASDEEVDMNFDYSKVFDYTPPDYPDEED